MVTATSDDLVTFTLKARKNILLAALAGDNRKTPETSVMVTGIELASVQYGDGVLVTGKVAAMAESGRHVSK